MVGWDSKLRDAGSKHNWLFGYWCFCYREKEKHHTEIKTQNKDQFRVCCNKKLKDFSQFLHIWALHFQCFLLETYALCNYPQGIVRSLSMLIALAQPVPKIFLICQRFIIPSQNIHRTPCTHSLQPTFASKQSKDCLYLNVYDPESGTYL